MLIIRPSVLFGSSSVLFTAPVATWIGDVRPSFISHSGYCVPTAWFSFLVGPQLRPIVRILVFNVFDLFTPVRVKLAPFLSRLFRFILAIGFGDAFAVALGQKSRAERLAGELLRG